MEVTIVVDSVFKSSYRTKKALIPTFFPILPTI